MNAPVYVQVAPKKGKGCLFYGCLTVVIVGLLAAVMVGVGGYLLVKKAGQMMEQYTGAEPMEMPVVQMEEGVYQALAERVDGFGRALKEGKPAGDLELTSEELNALLNRNSSMQLGSMRMNVVMKESEVSGQVSVPLDGLADVPGFKRLKGRYLNGNARLGVEMQEGRIVVRLLGMEVNGQQLPAEVLRALANVNWLEEAYKDPKSAEVLAKIRSVAVEQGVLRVSAAGGGAEREAGSAER
jgi:hypothetical protein